MGDFGLAVMTNAEDPSNPVRYRGPGTQGYHAPVSMKDPAHTHVADL